MPPSTTARFYVVLCNAEKPQKRSFEIHWKDIKMRLALTYLNTRRVLNVVNDLKLLKV